MDEQIDTFLAITGSSDNSVAKQFLEMAGGDLETAIALFFEHGGAQVGGNGSTVSQTADEDAEFAQQLQREAYQEPRDVRDADSNAHYHDTLVDDGMDGFSFGGLGRLMPQNAPTLAMFGNGGNRGVFNQYEVSDEEMSDDYEDDYEDEERAETAADREVRERREHRKKLADMFRPPFEIISKMALGQAKTLGRQTKQWILVNIQDNTDFRCQILNRDLWSSALVKQLVKEHFIFLQYQSDAPIAADYVQFYPFTDYPHIAILDPLTGERLKLWSENPDVEDWKTEVYEFLDRFTVGKDSNPTVTHKKRLDPSELTEEQQFELAMKQSMGEIVEDTDAVEIIEGDESNPIDLDSDPEVPEADGLSPEQRLFAEIKPVSHEEPQDPATTTRIQIRTGDGKRVVRRFGVEDPVRVIFEVIKATFEQVSDRPFVLTSQRTNLLTELNKTIQEAGLKNASILLEMSDV
ncbi:hypothetical protein BABINDRAFT_6506 [Babjeviella inositovora NRRL Y-12698]|uniref:UBX domain-containing protein n=1 Tax=Babjeviella inositovora NRRL Y-12698 TaxID=984486 RepID=A0A1E3QXV3_9ASCO|nr:uncharacterized protein BABINDRAFT_6506 [Babjeviella inositovora NRRL Y-12698]ODQ81867.1 hypothetical protein BABINDRAFT_6506 [Babjeviella inositovora NRRL Y-12698]